MECEKRRLHDTEEAYAGPEYLDVPGIFVEFIVIWLD